MKLVMHKYALEVIKEHGDPRFSGVVNPCKPDIFELTYEKAEDAPKNNVE